MAILGKVAGTMLKDNLVRNGVDLIVDGNLMYYDVSNRRVGINTITPGNALTVNGSVTASNVYINNTTITALNSDLILSSLTGNISVNAKRVLNVGDPVNLQDAATKSYVDTAINSNIGIENGIIANINANVTAANSAISSTNANLAAANISILNLNSNITAANSAISTINANVLAANSAISGLRANITAANSSISSTNANVAAANVAISTLQSQVYSNSNVAAYLPVYSGNITTANLTITSGIASISSTTGAVVVTGGVGVSGSMTVGGTFTAGFGAMGIQGSTGNFGTNSGAANVTYGIATGAVSSGFSKIVNIGTGSSNGSTVTINVGSVNAAGNVIVSGNTLVYIGNSTTSTNTTTGALVVAGGTGIVGNLNVGGQINGYLNGPIGANSANTGVFTTVTTTSGGQLSGYHTGAIGANSANTGVFTTTVATSSNIGNFYIHDNIVTVTNTDGNINLTPLGNGIVSINTTTAIQMPSGNNLNRPSNPVAGMTRYNTVSQGLEVWDGSNWVSAGSGSSGSTVIVSDKFTGTGSQTNFTLSQVSTTAGTMVSINGVMQIPDVGYSISGNVLSLSEAALTTDIIEARTISSTSSVTSIFEGNSSIRFGPSTNSYPVNITVGSVLSMAVNLANTSLYNSLVLTSPLAPSTAGSAGTRGQIEWDSSYVYVCVANNTWKRANLSSW